MPSTFLLSVIVVRTLDAREAATFFAILAALSIGPMIGRLGLGPNVTRLMPAESDPEARRQIAGTHLQATFLLSCLSAPLIALVGCNGLLGHSGFLPAFVLTTLLIIIESTRLMVSDIFAAAGRVRASVLTMHYIRSLLTLPLVALVVFVVSRPSLVAVLATYLAVAATQFTVAVILARHDVAIFRFSAGISTLRKAIGQGTQLFSLEFSYFFMMQGTIWLATAAFSPVAATQYAAAATLAMQVTLLESLAGLAITPPAARLWAAGQKAQVVRTLSNAATLSTFVTIIVVGLLAILGPFALEVAYGSFMRPASTMLLILAASGIFQACFNVSITMLVISGYIAAAARTSVVVTIVAVPLAVVAAWLSGPIALAAVSSLSISALLISQWLTARKILRRVPHAHYHLVRAARELMSDPDANAEPSELANGSPPGTRTQDRSPGQRP
jgi:O-antigen/teichoic acid export membrane protein